MFLAEDDFTAYIHVPYIFDGIHTHDHFEINYVYHGQCSFFILAPDTPHNVYTEGDRLILSIMVHKTTKRFYGVSPTQFKKRSNPRVYPLRQWPKSALAFLSRK